MAPSIAAQGNISLNGPPLAPFSAINGPVLRDSHNSAVIRSCITEASGATLEVALPKMPGMPLNAQSDVEQMKRSSGEIVAISVRASTTKVKEGNSTRNESGSILGPIKAKGVLQNTTSRSTLVEVVTSESHSSDDRNCHDLHTRRDHDLSKTMRIPGAVQMDSYKEAAIAGAVDRCLPRLSEMDDQMPAVASDSSTIARGRVLRNSHDDKCSIVFKPEYGAFGTMEVVSTPKTLALPTAASEQRAMSNYIPHHDHAISGSDAQVAVDPDIDQPSSNEAFKDVLHPPSTVIPVSALLQLPQRLVPALESTIDVHPKEINKARCPDHIPVGLHTRRSDEASVTEPSGVSHIQSRKRKAPQELIDQIPTVDNNPCTKTRATTQPSVIAVSKAANAANNGTSAQAQEWILKFLPQSSAIAPIPGRSTRDHGKRTIKPEIFVTDSQSSLTKWPYGDLRNHTIDSLFARLAKTYKVSREQAWAVQFTFLNEEDKPSLIVSRKNPDSLGQLSMKMWEVSKTCKDKTGFQIYADPRIDSDAKRE
ncbi:hypothetical protein MMC17_005546 [Xylographa soralifera]|nr:hypothetical protein [Xylographa soralifera]